MTDDRATFQKLVEEGDSAAWNKDWRMAIERYMHALKLVPEDPDVHISLGLALLNSKQLERALSVFKRANQLAPDDPVPLESSADVLERMGQLREAAAQYVKVADIYLGQRDIERAIGNWERATQLTPGLVAIHARLAQAYERIGQNQRAIREYLTLAFNFRRLDETDKAIRAVERALRLDKNNAQALNTLRALQSGSDVVLPPSEDPRKAPPKPAPNQEDIFDPFSTAPSNMPESRADNDLGPLGEGMEDALGILAAHVVESGLDDYALPALKGMEFQRQGLYEPAIEAYQQADQAGLRHPSLKMNLGGLFTLVEDPEAAIPYLKEALNNERLTAGALHGLALSHHMLGNAEQAARYYIQSLQAVDVRSAPSSKDAQKLNTLYENILKILDGRSIESLSAINERFLQMLSGKDWHQRVPETRRQMEETMRMGGGAGLVDFLVAEGTGELTESITLIDRYIHQGLYTLAMNEAQQALESSPNYLPVHVRMAEIMMKEGRIRQAIVKYTMIARSYMVRDEKDRAASILLEVLEMAPLDVEVRTTLIELLETEQRWLEALEQYIELAITYQQLGDFERSMQTLSAAERLARRINAPSSKLVDIKHALAEIFQMRLNTRQAQKIYEDILELASDDEKALRQLVDILYGQGSQLEAVKRLDALLGIYARKGMVTRITQLLEQLVNNYPKDTALRSRLASIYKRLGQIPKAIEQLDTLGELQLDAGLTKDAANTIRQIISLKPDNVEQYKRLLQQLNA